MLLVVPVLGAVLLGVLVPRQNGLALKAGGAGVALVNLILAVVLWARFDPAQPGLQFEENVPWIRALSFQVNYHLGVDGISLLLVALTAFLMVLAFLGSWNVTERVKEYVITLLVLESAMLGVFLAADLLLFYIFWEVTMIPMFLLIGIWGGARRIYASIKFVLFTAAGSLVMLVAMVSLAWTYSATTGQTTFDLEPVLRMRLPVATQVWLFAAFALAFAIKVPLFPLHTWLPDAHVEAPTAGSVILAGVLLKMGTYGFLRFCLTLFPEASYRFAPILVALALVGIV
ncbi:MAG TPA: NADH-quinone oxidoreductase subunit M, partial [Armatimonadota bacterium]|nr:NADH-quinone oxidoreductase subunit M [Armatimonadota bacterium]